MSDLHVNVEYIVSWRSLYRGRPAKNWNARGFRSHSCALDFLAICKSSKYPCHLSTVKRIPIDYSSRAGQLPLSVQS